MELLKNIHMPATLTGLVLMLFGLNVIITGQIWNLVLVSPEKYFVGLVALFAGAYTLLLGIKIIK